MLFIVVSLFLGHSIPLDSMQERGGEEREGRRDGGKRKGSFEFKHFVIFLPL